MRIKDSASTASRVTRTLFRILVASTLAIFYFLFQMQYMQHYLDWDQYAYSGNVARALVPGNTALLNPHHLHFELGGRFFHNLMVDLFGKYGFTDLAYNLRLRSLLAASIGIFFAVLFLSNITKRLFWGIIGGAIIGFLHGYIHYATKIDTGIFPAASIIPLFWAYERLNKADNLIVARSLLCGFVAFVCVMMHQYSVIGFAILSVCMLVPGKIFYGSGIMAPFSIAKDVRKPLLDSRASNRLKAALVFSLSGALFIVAAYFYAGETHYNLRFDEREQRVSSGTWAQFTFQKWLVSYATTDMWGHGIARFDPRAPIRGFTDACLSQAQDKPKYNANYKFAYDMKDASTPDAFSNNLLAFFTLFSIGGSILLFPALVRRYGRTFLALFLCLVAYCIFFTYWEPFYFEFWIIPAILVTMTGLLALDLCAYKLTTVIRGFGGIPFYACALFIAFVFVNHNMSNYIKPYSEKRYTQGISYSIDPERYEWIYSPSVYKNPE